MSKRAEGLATEEKENDRPPFLGSWGRLYAVVVIYLAGIIAAFAWFSASFRL